MRQALTMAADNKNFVFFEELKVNACSLVMETY